MSNTKQSIASRMDLAFSGSSINSNTRLQKNKPYNQFTGLILHSFAKQSEGKKLTNLEEKLVNCFLESDYSDQDLAGISKSYREASTTTRSSMLPGKFAQLTTNNHYSFEDLCKDLPLIGNEAIKNSQNLGLINTDRAFITKDIIPKAKEHLRATKDANAAVLEKELDALLPKKERKSYAQASAELGWSAQIAGRANNFSDVASTNSGTWDFWAVEMECLGLGYVTSHSLGLDAVMGILLLSGVLRSLELFLQEMWSLSRKIHSSATWLKEECRSQ
ncbi:hypothetical protein K7432_001952 [Basidiobolus ranarum]|uniref:Uncharacterized protein n=1 Tax=Basidiobolus ranarum TaxID=34480 RepID=A0ABR2W8T5_9FUNG